MCRAGDVPAVARGQAAVSGRLSAHGVPSVAALHGTIATRAPLSFLSHTVLFARTQAGHDFVEGVHARVMDKPRRTPRWSPAKLSDVREADVDRYFAPLPAEEELRLLDHAGNAVP